MLKYLEPSATPKELKFHVYGVGVDELMPPCIVNRPNGRGDWLFMHFHDPVTIMTEKEITEQQGGTFMIWKPGNPHYYGSPDKNWRHSWLHCHGMEVDEIVSENNIRNGIAGIIDDRELINRIFIQIYDEIIQNQESDLRILKNLFENFVIELARKTDPDKKNQSMPERLMRAKKYIEQNYRKKVKLEKLAALSALSVPQFCAEFKKNTGTSPIDMLIKTRIRHAVYLLSNINLSVGEVASMCGYSDPFQFSKIFRKHVGRSPRKFRTKTSNPERNTGNSEKAR